MTKLQRKRITKVLQITVLGVSTLTGLAGHVGIAIAGIAIYLTILHIEGDN